MKTKEYYRQLIDKHFESVNHKTTAINGLFNIISMALQQGYDFIFVIEERHISFSKIKLESPHKIVFFNDIIVYCSNETYAVIFDEYDSIDLIKINGFNIINSLQFSYEKMKKMQNNKIKSFESLNPMIQTLLEQFVVNLRKLMRDGHIDAQFAAKCLKEYDRLFADNFSIEVDIHNNGKLLIYLTFNGDAYEDIFDSSCDYDDSPESMIDLQNALQNILDRFIKIEKHNIKL